MIQCPGGSTLAVRYNMSDAGIGTCNHNLVATQVNATAASPCSPSY
jgi:hypothetical protein